VLKKIISYLFVKVDLYYIDLRNLNLFQEINFEEHQFLVLQDISRIDLFYPIGLERGDKFIQIVKNRLTSGKYYCFCFFNSKNNEISYLRWLKTDSFYHMDLKDTIDLKLKDAFTLDSYTPYKYRSIGLHKEMNKRMLNYCKNQLNLNKIFMVIFSGKEFEYLHKTVEELGYVRIKTKSHINFKYFKLILNKLIQHA
jgi:hypothetical protein